MKEKSSPLPARGAGLPLKGEKLARVSVIGGAGYAGGELLRILALHPNVTISRAISESSAGKRVAESFPGFGRSPLAFTKLDLNALVAESDLIFLAQENGFAMRHAAALLEAGKIVIDLSADFRLRDSALYPEWYKFDHVSAGLLNSAAYGLPELHRDKIRGARLIANPGCYPTASILAASPLVRRKLIDPDSIVIDAKSGVSGAGRAKHSLDYHFTEVNENMRAYGVGGAHRHTPEIEQELSAIAGTSVRLTFTPHLIPISRGILATVYARPLSKSSTAELHAIYEERYASEPFVVVLPKGQLPHTKGCSATNLCQIGVVFDERANRIIVLSAIDNLVKGAAGQAVQNMNIVLGFEETAGLNSPGVWP